MHILNTLLLPMWFHYHLFAELDTVKWKTYEDNCNAQKNVVSKATYVRVAAENVSSH
jgi:hypothetical protein